MTRLRRRFSPLAVLTGLALSIGVLSGCTPTPEPTPTPTSAFASEEEAFAAAEETYRAYTKAVNDKRSGQTEADPLNYLIAAALEDHLASEAELDAEELSIEGQTLVERFDPVEASLGDTSTITASICLDISGTRVLDADGADITPLERLERAELEVEFVGDESALLISTSELATETPC